MRKSSHYIAKCLASLRHDCSYLERHASPHCRRREMTIGSEHFTRLLALSELVESRLWQSETGKCNVRSAQLPRRGAEGLRNFCDQLVARSRCSFGNYGWSKITAFRNHQNENYLISPVFQDSACHGHHICAVLSIWQS